MPNNKSHHYVPRFYLRNFSRSGKHVDLFNIEGQRLINGAPIKGQCCRDYFYGKDATSEKGLSVIEGEVARLFHTMFEMKRLPHYFTSAHFLLCFHIAIQASRTQYAVDALNTMTDGMFRQVVKHDPEITPEMLEHVKFGYENPGLFAIQQGVRAYPLLMDLECRVLLAPLGTEFITSDNPVVRYNQFMLWRNHGSNTGMATKGLQIFFPIWPFLTLVMYDRDVYHFGHTKSTLVHMASARDVHELNMLQVAAASKNVYLFSQDANVFKVAQDAIKYRRKKKGIVQAFPQPDKGNSKSEILVSSYEDIRANVGLNFMRINSRAKTWLKNFRSMRIQPAAVPRDELLVKRLEVHHKAEDEGKADPQDVIMNVFGRPIIDGVY